MLELLKHIKNLVAILAIMWLFMFAAPAAFGQNIPQANQITTTSTPYTAITTRTPAQNLYIPFASATTSNLYTTTLCLIGDVCRTTWPTGSGVSGGVANLLAVFTSATTIAPSSTPQVAAINATSTNATSTFASGVLVGLGSASLPSLSFIGDPDTGIFDAAANQLDLVTGGSARAAIISNLFQVNENFEGTGLSGGYLLFFGQGLAATPSYTFVGDTDTGLFHEAANTLGFSTNGIEHANLDTSGNLTASGTVNALGVSTSTFAGTIAVASTTATSTFAYGINLISGGCYAVGGVCPATTTLSGGGPITVSNSPVLFGASGAVLGCSTCVLTSRNVNTTYPLTGGGALSGDLTLATAFGTTSTWGLGTNGLVLTNNTGVPYVVASSSLSLPNTALQNSSIVVTTASPLGGAGTINLGGTLALTCAGCLTSITTANLPGTRVLGNIWFDGTNIVSTSSIFTVGSLIGTTTATSTFAGPLLAGVANSTSTFTGGLAANLLNITSSSATSSFGNGINLIKGCVTLNGGSCLTGTVNSVGLSLPTGFTITNSPVTTSGTLTATLSSGFSVRQLPTYFVAASGGNFTTIQGALTQAGTDGGATIYLTDTTYAQGGTGLTFRGSNTNVYCRTASTTITFTGATTGFKTNSAAGAFTHNGVHGCTITGDANAGGVAIDFSDMSHSVYEDNVISSFARPFKVDDTQNITFYNSIVRNDISAVSVVGIDASSTNPTNANTIEDNFIGCSSNGCIGMQFTNANGNTISKNKIEPDITKTSVVDIKIFDNTLATCNGVFNNDFKDNYLEGGMVSGAIGVSIADNKCANGGIQRNIFENTTSENHTTDWSVSNYELTVNTFINNYNSNFGNPLTTFEGPFGIATSTEMQAIGNTPYGYFAIAASSSQAVNEVAIGNQANRSDFIISNSGKVGLGTTTPWSVLGIMSSSLTTNLLNLATTSTKSLFRINSAGQVFTGGNVPTCGAGCASVSGDEHIFRIITGVGVTVVTVNFPTTWKNINGTTITPGCWASDESGGTTVSDASSTPTAVTMNLSASLTTKMIVVKCEASDNFTF